DRTVEIAGAANEAAVGVDLRILRRTLDSDFSPRTLARTDVAGRRRRRVAAVPVRVVVATAVATVVRIRGVVGIVVVPAVVRIAVAAVVVRISEAEREAEREAREAIVRVAI